MKVDEYGKEEAWDFALWKAWDEDDGDVFWETELGKGRPGWHIECSAMASKYLGKHFDIHTGGEDHIPVHHENEIAQSECGFGVNPWVKYWMHGAFLTLKGGKMSKSSGKIKTISQLEKGGINPLAYKYFCYSAHYRKPLTWSDEAINSAVKGYKRLKNIIEKIKDSKESKKGEDGGFNNRYLKEFEKKINDDLDMPGALAVLWGLVRDDKAKRKVTTIKKMDEVFGLKLLDVKDVEIPEDVKLIAGERQKAREEKDWVKSDLLRDKLKGLGWIVKDNKERYLLERG